MAGMITKDMVLNENILNLEHPEDVLESAELYIRTIMEYNCALREVKTKFSVINDEMALTIDRNPIEHIKTRVKQPISIIRKLERKGIPITIKNIEENIFDVAGIRVVCSYPEDVYKLAGALSNQDDITVLQKKDYIKNPKENGYRSYHMVVQVPIFLLEEKKTKCVEIQLRTIAMDFWASLEHKMRYKKDIENIEFVHKELLECAKLSSNLDQRMQKLRHIIESR
ncbi:GTP pyrophosphokinase [Phosphitispora sp. TUW77]|uniref:GTP pyrophosphokinase n=1 Tax=Phosphitispora sp. TUW77 TaxID=3152361 RepID=UPI003AB2A607